MSDEKLILDVACGGRMFWFNKKHPNALYCDIRECAEVINDGRFFEVKPDVVCDFTALPFADNSFYHVVFDPPQMLYAGRGGQMVKHYGILPKEWRGLIHDGFCECMRVLKEYGTLVFKWSEHDIPTKDVIAAIGQEPLYGHKSGRAAKTHWMIFMKGVGE